MRVYIAILDEYENITAKNKIWVEKFLLSSNIICVIIIGYLGMW